MGKHHALIWIGVVLVVLIVGTVSFQGYYIFQLNKQLEKVSLDLKSTRLLLDNSRESLNQLILYVEERFSQVDKELHLSSSQIIDLKRDVSHIQVESQDFSGIVDEVLPSVVSVLTNKGQGSGVIISEDGYIVTNYHVIQGARVVNVFTFDEELYQADVIGIAKKADIALLKIDEDNLDFLKFGDSKEVRVGQRVIALGNPAGLDFSVTEGIVSAVDRVGLNGLEAYIQVDVPINPGNSGGPLVNIKKEIVGINNFKLGGSYEALGFALESNLVKEIVDEIFEELERQEN